MGYLEGFYAKSNMMAVSQVLAFEPSLKDYLK